jgi:short-subunit dehydrogenase
MNKIWLIGASEGIGRALAEELGQDADNFLILSARDSKRLDTLSSGIKYKSMSCPLDVADNASVEIGWKDIISKIETIDTLIYCAGYFRPMTSDSIDVKQIEKMININLVGAYRVLSYVVPEFVRKQKGHIVLISSIAGYRGLPKDTGYGSSKSGLIHLAENLNCDLAKHGINVQLVNPGFVKTRLTDLNDFKMPSLMTTKRAATFIKKGIKSQSFEIKFPFFFSNFIKILSLLPYRIYFWLMKKIK